MMAFEHFLISRQEGMKNVNIGDIVVFVSTKTKNNDKS